jgi:hypothetical protein
MASGDSIDEIQVIDSLSKLKTDGNATDYKDEDNINEGKSGLPCYHSRHTHFTCC